MDTLCRANIRADQKIVEEWKAGGPRRHAAFKSFIEVGLSSMITQLL